MPEDQKDRRSNYFEKIKDRRSNYFEKIADQRPKILKKSRRPQIKSKKQIYTDLPSSGIYVKGVDEQ
jgi:hypothetical protein